jgi:hypothetical protein
MSNTIEQNSTHTILTGVENVKIVGLGIDTLELGYCVKSYNVSGGFWDTLEEQKQLTQKSDYENDDATVSIFGVDFKVSRHGSGMWRYILVNDDITLRLNPKANEGKAFPEAFVIFRSAFLWRKGYLSAISKVNQLMERLCDFVNIKPSRVDLCADIVSPLPELDLNQFVTYAHSRDEYQISRHNKGNHLSGYVVGSDVVRCRIYDKAYECVKEHKQWFHDLWRSHDWDGKSPVTRIEFQYRREGIRPFQIDNLNDLLNCIEPY